MTVDDLLKTAVPAAIIAGIVGVIGAAVSSWTALRINRDKLKLDQDLLERRAKADLDLAERKAALDRGVAIAKRKAEVAELVLKEFYEVRNAFGAIRSPLIWAGEMVKEEGVPEEITTNDGYGVTRRLRHHDALFASLEATRFTFVALFGPGASEPYVAIIRAYNEVQTAAQHLLEYRIPQPSLDEFLRGERAIAFAGGRMLPDGSRGPDPIAERIEKAVQQIETFCRPALEAVVVAPLPAPHGET